jgi:hypothetical protein
VQDRNVKAEREAARQTKQGGVEEAAQNAETKISENWAEETIADLDDFIESQGIYIRQ